MIDLIVDHLLDRAAPRSLAEKLLDLIGGFLLSNSRDTVPRETASLSRPAKIGMLQVVLVTFERCGVVSYGYNTLALLRR